MDEPRLTKVACPSCGSPLLFEAGVISMRCQFCQAVVERPLQPGRPATLKDNPPARPQARHVPSSSPPSALSTGFRGVLLFLSILLAAGLALLAVILVVQNAPSAVLNLGVTGPAAAISADRVEGPDFVVFGYDSPGESYLLARIDPVAKKVVWRGKHFDDISAIRTIVADGDKFFTIEGRDLHAYSAADGKELWLARLSDEVGYCEECLSAADGRVIALTQDYVIQAFDAESGVPAWKRRMGGYTGGFQIADGSLWVIDDVDDRSVLLQLGLSDGGELSRIEPECVREDGYASSTLNASSLFLLDPQGSVRAENRSLYIWYGWSPGCIERWDANSASQTWQIEDESGFSPSGDYTVLAAPETLFFTERNTLWATSAADGRTRLVLEDEDYELVPLALEQGVLVLRTKRTRGTTQFGLRGVDPDSGATLWEHEIEDAEPLEPPEPAFSHVDEDDPIFSVRWIDGRIRLSLFQANPTRISFVTIDPKNGRTFDEGVLALNFSYADSYFGPVAVAWKPPVLWFIADSKILGVDISAAKLLYSMP